MSFLSPATIALAAGLTVPPLIALYFLKLKRSVRLVPSTLLWKKSVEDLHVNSPFQRLRSSVLLLLQLLVLLLAALAL
ncbi:MAG: BatA domain-containing protein, partial [Planctomycetes bacterium]|nr:BatA domain-containing protein [Planctomycetota bacterium]